MLVCGEDIGWDLGKAIDTGCDRVKDGLESGCQNVSILNSYLSHVSRQILWLTKFKISRTSRVPDWYLSSRLVPSSKASGLPEFWNGVQSSNLVPSSKVPGVPEFQTGTWKNSGWPRSKVPRIPKFRPGTQVPPWYQVPKFQKFWSSMLVPKFQVRSSRISKVPKLHSSMTLTKNF